MVVQTGERECDQQDMVVLLGNHLPKNRVWWRSMRKDCGLQELEWKIPIYTAGMIGLSYDLGENLNRKLSINSYEKDPLNDGSGTAPWARLAFAFHGWWPSWYTPWCIGAIPEISESWRRNTRKESNVMQLPFDPRAWGELEVLQIACHLWIFDTPWFCGRKFDPFEPLSNKFKDTVLNQWNSFVDSSASPSTDCKVWIARNASLLCQFCSGSHCCCDYV